MSGLSNIYLNEMLKNEVHCSKTFIGVFSADNIDVDKLKFLSRFILIVNLSPQEYRGTHFVTIVGSPREIIYCDSYALTCNTSQVLHESLLKIGRNITHMLKYPIQSINSEFCGFFCVFFVCFFDYERFPIIKQLKNFSKHNLNENDAICMSNIKQLIKKN